MLSNITDKDNVDDDYDALVTKSDFTIELVLDDNNTIDVDEAKLLNPVDTITLDGDDIDLERGWSIRSN